MLWFLLYWTMALFGLIFTLELCTGVHLEMSMLIPQPTPLYGKLTTQLAQQRCENVVTTSLLTLSQRCDMVKNESCADVGFRRCDNVALRRYQDIATT